MRFIFLMTLLSATFFIQSHSIAKEAPIKVKVFIGTMFEIGKNTGDKAGEFQYWYEKYFKQASTIPVKGALTDVYCNQDGVCGSVLGMGKVASSSSMQAILLNNKFDFSHTYFLISGVAGTPPNIGTIGDVTWGTWLVDYDLGHRWAPEEGEPNTPVFMPRKGYENIRKYKLNADLVNWSLTLTQNMKLFDSSSAQAYRKRYAEKEANRAPKVLSGTHMTGDTFFHGPGLSKEAQYIAKLYGADDYVSTEMEAAAIAQVISRTQDINRMMSIRGSVNFDQGGKNETTLEHLDPAPGETAGGFAETVNNITLVGGEVVDHIVENWASWQSGVPKL